MLTNKKLLRGKQLPALLLVLGILFLSIVYCYKGYERRKNPIVAVKYLYGSLIFKTNDPDVDSLLTVIAERYKISRDSVAVNILEIYESQGNIMAYDKQKTIIIDLLTTKLNTSEKVSLSDAFLHYQKISNYRD